MKRQPRARCKEQETALIHPPSCKVVGNGQRVKKPNSVPFVRISDVGEETIMGEERKPKYKWSKTPTKSCSLVAARKNMYALEALYNKIALAIGKAT
ncbi:predicted protein [Sclerotinia sclerotiorum 1980 UF-70]|uniref:Uncharacterized protein n=1 Tax=Sclerotinia sclerotiorum (strain ATCC 18683 / 1980 / Ss-1) TaxID=665079 RepID=A7EEI2_SCLS1|nr:predicted protein [Sclerotinia sclerotiorum 1980 UF-70]EDO01248.1 predicted protein [Sclerotinia sclerotiorum 1980 UF-70]